MSAHFGQLREHLQTPPEDQRWGQLCMLLEDFSGHELLELALPYLEDHLKRWPHLERRVPMLWLERAMRAQAEPRLSVCRMLAIHTTISLEQARALAACEELNALERVKLTANSSSEESMYALAQARWWSNIKDLELGHNLHSAILLAELSLNPEIETLCITAKEPAEANELLYQLITQGPLTRLTTLELGMLDGHATSSHPQLWRTCPQLKTLTLSYEHATDAPEDLSAQLPPTLNKLWLHLYHATGSDQRFWRAWVKDEALRGIDVTLDLGP